MDKNFSLDIIKQFRDTVNEKGFVVFKYANVDGKCLWNCVCSAMDWITVAMEYLVNVKAGKIEFKHSMEIYAYISAIDNVWEAVRQLHRVFINEKTTPFSGENDIFKEKFIKSKDDNTYFKEIRAVFGAHPVNLSGEQTGEHYYASWPTNECIGKGDYSVLLYNSKYEKCSCILFDIFFSELDRFLLKRYEYLKVIEKKIIEERNAYFEKMKRIVIERSDQIDDQLDLLKKASKERLDSTFINSLINELKIIYTTRISHKSNKEMVDDYRKDLLPIVNEIYLLLQNMDFDTDLNCNILFESGDVISSGVSYYVGKLSDILWREQDYPNNDIFVLSGIRRIFEKRFLFSYESIEELYILVHASIHQEYICKA